MASRPPLDVSTPTRPPRSQRTGYEVALPGGGVVAQEIARGFLERAQEHHLGREAREELERAAVILCKAYAVDLPIGPPARPVEVLERPRCERVELVPARWQR